MVTDGSLVCPPCARGDCDACWSGTPPDSDFCSCMCSQLEIGDWADLDLSGRPASATEKGGPT